MKAIGYDRYTAAAGLQLVDVDVPQPKANEVLVRVDAAALNAFDWHMYGGDPRVMRFQAGLRVKDRRFVGADFAGTVEAIGADVTSVVAGDRVLAETGGGGCAEYAVANVDSFAKISDSVDSASAAAAVMGGLTSLQALRDTAKIQTRRERARVGSVRRCWPPRRADRQGARSRQSGRGVLGEERRSGPVARSG